MPPKKIAAVSPADPQIRALRAEIIDLRQAFLILLDRHDNLTVPMIERSRSADTDRLIDLEQRIIALEGRDPPGPSVRKRVNVLENAVANLENSHLIAHERLDKLEGGNGLDPEEQADNSRPIIIGGWINVYATEENGLPILNGPSSNGPFETRPLADQHHELHCSYIKRLACLYLQGNDEDPPDPDWEKERD